MNKLFAAFILAVAGAFGLAFPAASEISAQQLKNQVIGFYESVGYEVSIASEETDGDTLWLRDVSVTMDLPENEGRITLSFEDIGLTETPDGSVEIDEGSVIAFSVTATPEYDDEFIAVGQVLLEDTSIVASGDVNDMVLTTGMGAMSLQLEALVLNGEDIPLNILLDASNLVANYNFAKSADGLNRVSGDSLLGNLNLQVDARENDDEDGSEQDGVFSLKFSTRQARSTFSSQFKEGFDIDNILDNGFHVSGTTSIGVSQFEMNLKDGSELISSNGSLDGVDLSFDISADGISYDISESGMDVYVASSSLPIPPVNLRFDELALGFSMPLSASDAPQEFRFKTALRQPALSKIRHQMCKRR